MDTVPIVFTLAELWILQGFVRHDERALPEDKYPLKSTDLNGTIALAISTCERVSLKEHTLLLSYEEMLLIDAAVPQAVKTEEGGRGKDILLKICNARSILTMKYTLENLQELESEPESLTTEEIKDKMIDFTMKKRRGRPPKKKEE